MSLRLTFNTKLAYGVGQLAEGLKNSALSTFLLFYYNQVLGLPGTLAGLALAIALIFDAFTDPLIGSISDNWHGRMGRRHPFMYVSALPFAICFFLLFAPPEGLSEWGMFVWLTVSVLFTRGAMTLFHVPHIALGAELSTDYIERSQVVSYRYVFSFVGYFLSYGLGFAWFFRDSVEFPRGQFNVDAYAPYAICLAVFMVVSILWSARGTHHRIPFLPRTVSPEQRMNLLGIVSRMFRDTISALRNSSFAWLFAGTLVYYMMVGVDTALNLYLFEFFWDLDAQAKMYTLMIGPFGVIVGAMIAPSTHDRISKRTGMMIGTTGWALVQIVPIILRFKGWFPENGTSELVVVLIAAKFLQGVAAAQTFVAFNSMLADIADEQELLTQKRQEGIFFAAASFASKATSGIGTLFAGVALDFINWPRGAHIQTAADIPVQTIASLGMIYGPVVCSFSVFTLLFYFQCKMTREAHEQVVSELEARRAQHVAGNERGRA